VPVWYAAGGFTGRLFYIIRSFYKLFFCLQGNIKPAEVKTTPGLDMRKQNSTLNMFGTTLFM
jgi:hypothetical protein